MPPTGFVNPCLILVDGFVWLTPSTELALSLNKSQSQSKINFWEFRESNPGQIHYAHAFFHHIIIDTLLVMHNHNEFDNMWLQVVLYLETCNYMPVKVL